MDGLSSPGAKEMWRKRLSYPTLAHKLGPNDLPGQILSVQEGKCGKIYFFTEAPQCKGSFELHTVVPWRSLAFPRSGDTSFGWGSQGERTTHGICPLSSGLDAALKLYFTSCHGTTSTSARGKRASRGAEPSPWLAATQGLGCHRPRWVPTTLLFPSWVEAR